MTSTFDFVNYLQGNKHKADEKWTIQDDYRAGLE